MNWLDEHRVSLARGAVNLTCAKRLMYMFEECDCDIVMISTECPSSYVFYVLNHKRASG